MRAVIFLVLGLGQGGVSAVAKSPAAIIGHAALACLFLAGALGCRRSGIRVRSGRVEVRLGPASQSVRLQELRAVSVERTFPGSVPQLVLTTGSGRRVPAGSWAVWRGPKALRFAKGPLEVSPAELAALKPPPLGDGQTRFERPGLAAVGIFLAMTGLFVLTGGVVEPSARAITVMVSLGLGMGVGAVLALRAARPYTRLARAIPKPMPKASSPC